jgi:hypothetical protein
VRRGRFTRQKSEEFHEAGREAKKRGLKSRFELSCMELMGTEAEYEKQRFPFVQTHNYTPDAFLYGVHWEFKGGSGPMGWPSDRRSAMRNARIQNEELRNMVVVLKYPNSRCTGKLTQSEWAAKAGFSWCSFEDFPEVLASARLAYQAVLKDRESSGG